MTHRDSASNSQSAAATLALGPEYRLTRQRREVYEVIKEQRDHPTATEVFIRAKARVPGISLATVYNCLETLTHSGLVKQVNLDRGPSRYCPNLKEHGHFHCETCGTIYDVDLPEAAMQLPKGYTISRMEVALRGQCPACSKAAKSARR
jgi:Fe2+ or Zn2+ uptake regulation protein